MPRNPAWTQQENETVATLYFAMLDLALEGQPYNKAAMIRRQQEGDLMARSRGSIEAKLMNCTAAHIAIAPSADTMETRGYRPLANYQADLKAAMQAVIDSRAALAYHGLRA